MSDEVQEQLVLNHEDTVMCNCGCTMTWNNPDWQCPECGCVEASE